MTSTDAPGPRAEAVDDYLSRIKSHLLRFADGHDPFGHLLAIERLARAARADWCEAERQGTYRQGRR